MAATLNLYVNLHTKKFMASQRSATEFVPPWFSEGDLMPITVKILQPDPSNPAVFTSPDISAWSLGFTVETAAGGTPFVNQPTWTKDTGNNRFTANVDFGTAQLSTWLSTSATKSGLLKLRLSDGVTTTTIIEQAITIRQNESGANPAAPTPGTRTLTYEEAEQIFARKYMNPGDTITFRTADGTIGRIIGIYHDGTEVVDQDEHVTI